MRRTLRPCLCRAPRKDSTVDRCRRCGSLGRSANRRVFSARFSMDERSATSLPTHCPHVNVADDGVRKRDRQHKLDASVGLVAVPVGSFASSAAESSTGGTYARLLRAYHAHCIVLHRVEHAEIRVGGLVRRRVCARTGTSASAEASARSREEPYPARQRSREQYGQRSATSGRLVRLSEPSTTRERAGRLASRGQRSRE